MDGEATQAQVRIDIRALHRFERWPSLLGKGYLIHVEAEAKASNSVRSAHGREPRDAAASLRDFFDAHGRWSRERILTVRNGRFVCMDRVRSASSGTHGDSFSRSTQNLTESIGTITVGGSISYRDAAGRHGQSEFHAAIRAFISRT